MVTYIPVILSLEDVFNFGLKTFIGFIVICVIIGIIAAIIGMITSTDKHQAKKAAREEAEWQRKLQQAGEDFERDSARDLAKVFEVPSLRNIILPHHNGNDTETDMMFVTKKGIFVVECKEHGRAGNDYYTGDQTILKGSADESEWDVLPPQGRSYKMDNPFRQNEHHMEAIYELFESLDKKDPVLYNTVAVNCHYSLIDFGKTITDKGSKGFHDFGDKIIVKTASMDNPGKRTLKKWLATQPDRYDEATVAEYTAILKSHIADEVTRAAHKRQAAEHNADYHTDM